MRREQRLVTIGPMAFAYPLMLDVTARRVLIVGGGGVALRKARGLLDAGATRITVVAPAHHPELPTAIERIIGRYDARLLEGPDLVFAATDDRAINDAVVRDCTARRIFVSRADRDDTLSGDFSTPAALRRGDVTVTVSAASAALSATIRDGLAARWDERWTTLAALMRDIRPKIVAHPNLSPPQRAALFRILASEDALDVAATADAEQFWTWIESRIPSNT